MNKKYIFLPMMGLFLAACTTTANTDHTDSSLTNTTNATSDQATTITTGTTETTEENSVDISNQPLKELVSVDEASELLIRMPKTMLHLK